MKNLARCFSCLFAFSIIFTACKKDAKEDLTLPPIEHKKNDIPEFYLAAPKAEWGKELPGLSLIAGKTHDLNLPQDLDFHPLRKGELWIINKDDYNSGGSTVTITKAGEPDQQIKYLRDGNAWHFMALPSAIAFSPNNGMFGTTANILDANRQGGTYTGPTLWSSDFNIYAVDHGTNGSHMDMLHGSPYCMGLAAHGDNQFWVFDGYHKELVFYDFANDHGPGNEYHGDGRVHRYSDVELTRTVNPSHMVLDQNKKWLYIVDGGTKRILRVDITTGTKKSNLPLLNEQLAEHIEMQGVVQEIFAETGLDQPIGIEIKDDRLFVSDYASGDIVCYSISSRSEIARINTGKPGIMGIKIGPDGKLWYVNATDHELFRVEPR